MCPTFVYQSGEAMPWESLNYLNGKAFWEEWCQGRIMPPMGLTI